ncbi:MAG: hypothetical protein KAS32_17650 [Candidatus Peribacteraceae bacterium]|nr:hypothetical protein [Candidatus Peribacteraceae bacterium]
MRYILFSLLAVFFLFGCTSAEDLRVEMKLFVKRSDFCDSPKIRTLTRKGTKSVNKIVCPKTTYIVYCHVDKLFGCKGCEAGDGCSVVDKFKTEHE